MCQFESWHYTCGCFERKVKVRCAFADYYWTCCGATGPIRQIWPPEPDEIESIYLDSECPGLCRPATAAEMARWGIVLDNNGTSESGGQQPVMQRPELPESRSRSHQSDVADGQHTTRDATGPHNAEDDGQNGREELAADDQHVRPRSNSFPMGALERDSLIRRPARLTARSQSAPAGRLPKHRRHYNDAGFWRKEEFIPGHRPTATESPAFNVLIPGRCLYEG